MRNPLESRLVRAVETAEAKVADAVRRLDEAEASGRGDPEVIAISRANTVPRLESEVEKAKRRLDSFYRRSRPV